jgi:hypothetical protein
VSYTEVTLKIHAETQVDLHVKCLLFHPIVTKIGLYTQMLVKLPNVKSDLIHSVHFLFAFNVQYTFPISLIVFKLKRSECIRLLPMHTFPNLLHIHNMVFWVVAQCSLGAGYQLLEEHSVSIFKVM